MIDFYQLTILCWQINYLYWEMLPPTRDAQKDQNRLNASKSKKLAYKFTFATDPTRRIATAQARASTLLALKTCLKQSTWSKKAS